MIYMYEMITSVKFWSVSKFLYKSDADTEYIVTWINKQLLGFLLNILIRITKQGNTNQKSLQSKHFLKWEYKAKETKPNGHILLLGYLT